MATKLTLISILCFGAAFATHNGIEEWNWLDSVSPNRQIQDNAFQPGREYHFFYNGQLTSGVAGASKQHSANRIQAIVTVAMKNQNHNILRLQNVRTGKMNRQIPNPRKIMPFDAFEETPIEQKLKQKLEAPVKFSYTGGLVRDVEFDSKEDPWSANIKRGVLNLLQVNLQQHRRQDAPEESRLTNNRQRNNEDGQQSFYRVMEETLEGECETLYTIQQEPGRHSNNRPVLNVSKSINFEKCNKRPQIKYNFRFNTKCPTCEPKYDDDEKFLKSSTVVQYNITGTKQAFLIESARTESQYVLTPFNEEANVIVTYVNQTLILVKTGPIQHAQEPQNPIRSDSNMIFTLDWDIAHEKFGMHGGNGDSNNQRILQTGQQGVNRPEMVKKILRKMTQQMKEQVDEELPQKFSHLVHWLRQCEQQELEQFTRQQEQGNLSPEEQKKAQNIIPQALGACGTKECVKQLTEKIRQGQIAPLKGMLALKGLLHNRVASKETINEVIQLAESEKAQQHQPLKRSAWLVAGSLINALCAENDDQLALEAKEDAKKLCGREQKEKYIEKLFSKLRQTNKWQDKVLMLKAIGNAGLDLSIFELEKIIRQQDSTQHPMYVRFEAILALRELKDDMPKKIQRVLMPVALNRREYPTIRSIATFMILQTQPERPILDQLARNLINEPSHQYASAVYTQLEAYANSTNPCEQRLATDCKLALRQAKRVSSGLGYSKLTHATFHSQLQKVGLDVDFGAIYSNTSAVPRHGGAALHVNALGHWQRYLATVTLFNEGLEPLIRDFANERGQFSFLSGSSSSNTPTHILRRHPRSTRNNNNNRNNNDSNQSNDNDQSGENEYERELDDIFSKHLRIRHRQYNDEYENEPKAFFTAMFKSQTVGIVPIGQEILQQIVQEGRAKASEFAQKLQRGLPIDYATVAQLHDQHLKIPTTLGLPLSVTIEAPVAISIKGKVQANVESLRSKTFKVQAELKPSAVATFVCQVEAWSPITTTGVKVQAKAKLFVPVDAKLDVDVSQLNNPQIKASVKQPTQKRDLLVLETRPITFTRSWQQYLRDADDQSSDEEQTIVGEELNRVTTFNKCYGKQTFGVDWCVRGQVQNTPAQSPKGTPFCPFSGQSKIVVTAQPGDSNQDIQIKINAEVQKLNGNDIHKPSFSSLKNGGSPYQDYDNNGDYSNEDENQLDDGYDDDDEQQQQQNQQNQRGSQQQQQGDSQQSNEQQQRQRRQQRQRQEQQQQRRQQRRNNQQQQQQQQGGRRNQQQRDTFQKYRDYQVKNGYKTKVNVELQAGSKGPVKVDLTHLYDAQQRYSKLGMKLDRQPDNWQVCLDAEMMFPEAPQFVDQVKEKKILAQAQLKWGQPCDGRNYIQLTAQAERSRQQMQWERRQSEYKQFNAKQQCRNNKAWCSPLAQEDFVEKIGQMMKYRLDIDYQNVPQSVKNATNKLYRALKHYYFWQTDVDQIDVQNPQNKIRAELVLDAQTKQRLNVTIKTPKENTIIQDLPLDRPIMVLNQKQSFGDQIADYINDEDEQDDQAQCSITGKTGWQRKSQVETFDGTTFSAPFTNCWVVLAKDCGSQKPEFVVLARKAQQQQGGNGDLKEVKIVTRINRIELKPDNDDYDSVKVTVNGQQYDPENDQDIEQHGHTIAKIDKRGGAVQVELPETGVQVQFDGYAINVQLSQYYQGQQCGLCGHFDKESADEFRNPDFTQEQDVRQFYMNYLIKDGNCQAPKRLNEVCQDEDCDQDKSSGSSSRSSSDEDDDDDNDDTTEKPDPKTKVIENDDQICFSTVPVPQCDDDSYPIEIKEQKRVPYTCVDQDSESAEELERQARYGKRAIQGVANRQPNFTRQEGIPQKCKKYNRN